MKIFKYPVLITDEFELKIPGLIKWLDVQMQGDQPYVWALVDEEGVINSHIMNLVGTGHLMDYGLFTYIGTFQQFSGGLVWHLFEVE